MATDTAEKESGAKARTPFVWRLLKGALVALLTAAVGCGVVWGLDALRKEVRLSPGYQMSSESLRCVTGPSWMTPEILAGLNVESLDPEFPRQFSLLDEDISAVSPPLIGGAPGSSASSGSPNTILAWTRRTPRLRCS